MNGQTISAFDGSLTVTIKTNPVSTSIAFRSGCIAEKAEIFYNKKDDSIWVRQGWRRLRP